MDKYEKKKCKKAFNTIKNNTYNYESFEAGFSAGIEMMKYALPANETINKFMAISNIYAITHPNGWSIKELQDFIKSKWNQVENPKKKEEE